MIAWLTRQQGNVVESLEFDSHQTFGRSAPKEKRPTGDTTHNVSQIFKIRDFLTGKLVATVLDLFKLAALLPFLFWMSVTLAWIVLVAAFLITIIVMAFLPVIGRVWGKLIAAETRKGAVLVETVHGIRTIKSLAIEKARYDDYIYSMTKFLVRLAVKNQHSVYRAQFRDDNIQFFEHFC